MDQLIELLQQIQDLAGVAIDALKGASGDHKPEGKPEGGPPHEGGKPPGEKPPGEPDGGPPDGDEGKPGAPEPGGKAPDGDEGKPRKF